jgi:tRNA nucleotidyltransferase/poly(A) polymerase
MLSGNEPKDFDVVTAATPETIMKLFADCDVKTIGKSFGVVLVNGFEVATFRHDRHHGIGDKNCTVYFAHSIQEDLSRRDFTVNAMAYCELTGEIVDKYNGRNDLKLRLIRFVGDPLERILEDPNRIIRACRFLAKLEGEFDLETRIALQENGYLVRDQVAPERIRLEILKAMELARPSLFFSALHSIDVLKYIFPAMDGCAGHPHGEHHLEDVFVHLMIAGDCIGDKDPILRLAAYLHDVGKPDAYQRRADGSFVHHDVIGTDIVAEELQGLKFSRAETRRITNLVSVHMANIRDISDEAMRKFLKKLADMELSFEDFMKLRVADRAGNRKKQPYSDEEIAALVEHAERAAGGKVPSTINSLAISGGELMTELNLAPGPIIGEIQRFLLEQVLEQGEEINSRQALLLLAGHYLKTLTEGG